MPNNSILSIETNCASNNVAFELNLPILNNRLSWVQNYGKHMVIQIYTEPHILFEKPELNTSRLSNDITAGTSVSFSPDTLPIGISATNELSSSGMEYSELVDKDGRPYYQINLDLSLFTQLPRDETLLLRMNLTPKDIDDLRGEIEFDIWICSNPANPRESRQYGRHMNCLFHTPIISYLDQVYRDSIGRSIARWQALSLGNDQSRQFAENNNIGNPRKEFYPNPSNPIKVLTGELGIGKSLIIERMLQTMAQKALENQVSSIPIYVSSKLMQSTLQSFVLNVMNSNQISSSQSIFIAIDEINGSDSRRVDELLNEARTLVNSRENVTIVIACRYRPQSCEEKEVKSIAPLTEEKAVELVSSLLDEDGNSMNLRYKIKDHVKVIQYPLYAILFASHLNRNNGFVSSRVDIVRKFIDHTVTILEETEVEVRHLLQKIAVDVVDNSMGFVDTPLAITTSLKSQILNTGVILDDQGRITFTLQLIADWFATEAINNGLISIQEILSTSRRVSKWFGVLELLMFNSNKDGVFQILSLTSKIDPVITSTLISNTASVTRDYMQPPSQEVCETDIYFALKTWISCIGDIVNKFFPLDETGKIRFPQVARNDNFVMMLFEYENQRTVSKNSRIPPDKTWSFQTTFEFLKDNITEIVKTRELSITSEAYENEQIWEDIYSILYLNYHEYKIQQMHYKRERLNVLPPNYQFMSSIPISSLKKAINFANERLGESNSIRWSIIDRQISTQGIHIVMKYVEELERSGMKTVEPPYFTTDKYNPNFGRTSVMLAYSDEELILRSSQILLSALEIYVSLVETWFSNIRSSLTIYSTLPAKLHVRMERSYQFIHPSCQWYFEPLPMGEQTSISVEINVEKFDRNITSAMYDRLVYLRPEFTRPASSMTSGSINIFRHNPALDFAYYLLKKDLKNIGWINFF